LDDELESKDWDVLILHYLGLDHIGHLGGPKRLSLGNAVLTDSIYMQPKQREMDGIIERIYNSLTKTEGERTLMVICGDHGMNDVYP
jgi:ethanolamine phosphate transferase 2 subunit G